MRRNSFNLIEQIFTRKLFQKGIRSKKRNLNQIHFLSGIFLTYLNLTVQAIEQKTSKKAFVNESNLTVFRHYILKLKIIMIDNFLIKKHLKN
ncbi:hypothetical protein BpHYR1_019974 [Brachionus plicatilis]|uniref:Uncharacterized protein n=1 Tax=Brachionus plicatilis TaxID=10195 RepID=A0A3M7PR66_BRAPC|nr:hypothetical protein BpHYR1_019974 [Brachionus plicatilis]